MRDGVLMERRTFVRGAFGLVALVTAGGLVARQNAGLVTRDEVFVTPEVDSPELADGPVMAAGIRLVPQDDGIVHGFYDDVRLFAVDECGAELVRLADGSRTIDDLAASLGQAVHPADVASFFVTLGQAGYLQNTVLVNLVEKPA